VSGGGMLGLTFRPRSPALVQRSTRAVRLISHTRHTWIKRIGYGSPSGARSTVALMRVDGSYTGVSQVGPS
jgi:hypothetical protein